MERAVKAVENHFKNILKVTELRQIWHPLQDRMGIHSSCILVSDVQGSCVLLFHWTLNRGGTLGKFTNKDNKLKTTTKVICATRVESR